MLTSCKRVQTHEDFAIHSRAALTIASGSAFADKAFAITAISSGPACQADAVPGNGSVVTVELCVIRGTFAHDVYVLKIDGKVTLKSIDDETTKGLSGRYQDRVFSLVCKPHNIKGNATAEEVQSIMSTSSPARVTELVELQAGSILPIEIGRLCWVSAESDSLMVVQVYFEYLLPVFLDSTIRLGETSIRSSTLLKSISDHPNPTGR